MPSVLGIRSTVVSKEIEKTLFEFELFECQVLPTSETSTIPAILSVRSLNLSLRLGYKYKGVPYFRDHVVRWFLAALEL